MPVAAITLMGTLVFVFINFLKALVNRDTNAWTTQMIVWVCGVAAVQLFAHSSLGPGIDLAGISLAKANFVDQLLVGLVAASLLSTVNEVKKAIDNKDSAVTGHLLREAAKPPQKVV